MSLYLYRLIFLGVFFLKNQTLAADSESYFTKVQTVRDSFFATELNLNQHNNKKTFELRRISFNPVRRWEEWRYTGIVVDKEFVVKNCSIYANKEIEKRIYLIRAFDCDHLSFRFEKQVDTLTLVPGMTDEKEELFYRAKNSENKIVLLVISVNENHILAWGRNSRYIKKSDSAAFYSIKEERIISSIELKEAVDISAEFIKGKTNPIVSDFIIVERKVSKGILD
ncbi:MAG: hypothetical protein SFU98_21795 [Leptospiraceae bacterium]|nr:hypothetical protein [Leptospiraceae bacterium]